MRRKYKRNKLDRKQIAVFFSFKHNLEMLEYYIKGGVAL
ncbi:hypothetical protein B4140_3298 [Bacillus amyloliquefaciens]|nr:hypothetical protein B4140_3298 [Bacillus amyloliquefaciens]